MNYWDNNELVIVVIICQTKVQYSTKIRSDTISKICRIGSIELIFPLQHTECLNWIKNLLFTFE